MKETKRSDFKFNEFSTWEIKENQDGEHFVVSLNIHNAPYKFARHKDRAEAYRKLLQDVAPTISRTLTIGRLLGVEL